MPGRVRFRIPALRRDPAMQRALETRLPGNGIRRLSVNAVSASLLLLCEPSLSLAEIERRVREAAARSSDITDPGAGQGRAWHSIDASGALAALDSGPSGLTGRAAAALLRRYGPNVPTKLPQRSELAKLVDQYRNLPVALLAGTAALSLVTGGTLDAAVVLAVLVLNGLIGFFSESWTDQTIASLERDQFPPAHALRDGKEEALPADRIVPGDLLLLRRDDVVPADARVVSAEGLALNEAALTGESLPVAKAANVLAAAGAPLAERRNMVFRGSMVVGGNGQAVVVATGDRTETSRVQALMGMTARPETPLQEELDRLGRLLVFGALGVSALVLLVGLIRGRRLLTMLRSAVSLGVAAIPESLPTMVTTTLAVDARRLSRQGLLVRRFGAIESLGAVRLVCFDKTGTLTLNRMTVTRLRWNGKEAKLSGEEYRAPDGFRIAIERDPDLARLIEVCVLCNDAQAADESAPGLFSGSSTETALLETAGRLGIVPAALRRERPRLAAIERSEGRRYMATLHETGGEELILAVKGDPMAVLSLCRSAAKEGKSRDLGEEARAAIEAENLAFAEAGLRVLGIACRQVERGRDLKASLSNLTWLGLVGLADPIRPGAGDLVRALRSAGIATVMLTGDQRATAVAIAAEIGLAPGGDVDVVEPDRLDSAAVADGTHRIFARLTPAQKLQVVADLQRSGMRVAMIGDGVNDTPALKTADVGMTLAESATGIARDVADIVLLGQDLSAFAPAFASGRSVRRNIRRAMRYLVATNLSEIVLMLFVTATGLGRPLSPGQLLWINLLSDVLPAMGLALEPAGPGPMERRPADADAPVLAPRDLGSLARDASVIAASALAAESWAAARRGPQTGAAVGFAGLMTGQLLYALACRPYAGEPPGGALIGALAASFAAEAAALFLPGLRNIAGRPLGLADLGLSAAAGLAPLGILGAIRAGDGARPS